MKISLVVACDENNAIGKDGDLPWHLPADLQYFKKITVNHMVVMGRTTWSTLQVQPLPRRVNIIMTRNTAYQADKALVCHSLPEVLTIAMAKEVDELMIIGGGQIYELFFPIADKLYVTEVQTTIENPDTYFVDFDKKNWHVTFEEPHAKNDKNQYAFTTKVYQRIKRS